jgi:hypothetical protein
VELLGHRASRHPVADLGLGVDEDGVGVDVGKPGTDSLKPVVLTLAMLFAVTFRSF